MVEFLESRGIEGATVLEIGGGVGEIHIELLKRGAERALNLELSPAYADEAQRLLREAGLEERADWRLHDIAASPEVIEPADIVVMNRVVCCYPASRRPDSSLRTVPTWSVTIPPDIGCQVTSFRPTSRMMSAIRSGLG